MAEYAIWLNGDEMNVIAWAIESKVHEIEALAEKIEDDDAKVRILNEADLLRRALSKIEDTTSY